MTRRRTPAYRRFAIVSLGLAAAAGFVGCIDDGENSALPSGYFSYPPLPDSGDVDEGGNVITPTQPKDSGSDAKDATSDARDSSTVRDTGSDATMDSGSDGGSTTDAADDGG